MELKSMSDWEFKTEDFDYKVDGRLHPTMAKDLANKKLQEWLASAQVVYSYNRSNSGWYETPLDQETHKALLIRIEPLAKCDHPKVHQMNVTTPDWGFNPGIQVEQCIYKCIECGAKVKPSAWEECE